MYKLVFDIGASNVKFAVMTNEGEILRRRSVPTPRESLESYIDGLCALAEPELDGADGIAISTNGRMYPDGNTYRAYTMDFLKGVNLKEVLEARLHLPVYIENDGLAATLGECWKGAACGEKNVLGIVLGSALGSGLVLNGKPYRGSKRNAAMVFGQLSGADTEKEKYTIGGLTTAFLLVLYLTAVHKGMQPGSITGPQLFELEAQGDPVACAMLENYYRSIAVMIYDCSAMLDLDCVVLTGGLSAQPSLVEGVRRNVKRIVGKGLHPEGIDFSSVGVSIDPKDFEFDIRAGELALDANLYGALYHALYEEA